MTFTQLGVDRLRFFLRGEPGSRAATNCCWRTPSRSPSPTPADPHPVILPADALKPVGFAPEEALLPWPARGFSGFRLLTEYFASREKFLFLDFTRLDAKTLVSAGNRLEIFVYLDRALPELERVRRRRTASRSAARRWSTCSRSAASRSRSTTRHRVSHRARRAAPGQPGGLEGRAGARDPAGRPFRPWRPFHRLTRQRLREPRMRAAASTTAAPRTTGGCPAPRSSCAARSRLRSRARDRAACCRSTRCASTAICRPTCRSAAAIRRCGWSRAPPPSPASPA